MDGQNLTESNPLHTRVNINLALKAARLGVWELDISTNILNWDDRCQQLFGLASGNNLPYKVAIRHIHPDDIAGVELAVKKALDPAGSGAYEHTYRTIGADDGMLRWVRFLGQVHFNEKREAYLFAGVAQEVSNELRLDQSEQKLAALIAQAPVATCLFEAKEMKITLANDLMLDIWGKDASVIGTPLSQAVPELEGQPFSQMLQNVFETGQIYEGKGEPADLERDGVLSTYYFDFSYKPIVNAAGEVYAVMDMAIDVTDQVLARKALEESESTLRGAIEIADMGIWELNMVTGITTYSERLKELFEFTQDYLEIDRLYNPIHEKDRNRLQVAVAKAATPGQGGFLDDEYTIVTQKTAAIE